jgi:hypothetical protein
MFKKYLNAKSYKGAPKCVDQPINGLDKLITYFRGYDKVEESFISNIKLPDLFIPTHY